MKNDIAVNPYLPAWEYIPDAEPHIFGDRVYIYGSHDLENGDRYCLDDYTVWSASVNDLKTWRRDTDVSYRRTQDPSNKDGAGSLAAPDCARGKDGRYYLYYVIGFDPISVAVSDRPEGPFTYYGQVTYPDGSYLKDGVSFDPAILVEESGNYLYYGFGPAFHHPSMGDQVNHGAYAVKLADDMKTVISSPVPVACGWETREGTSFEEHPFFEASSIRHYGEYYYFVYSSLQGHELCYAMGTSPTGPFTYKGVLVSNADLGYKGNTVPMNGYANNHGGLLCVDGRYYIFYHRHTHMTHFSRQTCAEEIVMKEDGTFEQAEITSCGLNGGPLPADRYYSAHIVCALISKNGASKIPSGKTEDPSVSFITEETDMDGRRNLYVHNLQNISKCAVRYMQFDGSIHYNISVEVRGGEGLIRVRLDDERAECAVIEVKECAEWTSFGTKAQLPQGRHTVWFVFEPADGAAMDFNGFEISK